MAQKVLKHAELPSPRMTTWEMGTGAIREGPKFTSTFPSVGGAVDLCDVGCSLPSRNSKILSHAVSGMFWSFMFHY